MNNTPRSFRLSKVARENLAKIADDYDISENKVVEILLTEVKFIDVLGEEHLWAENIIRLNFIARYEKRKDSAHLVDSYTGSK